MIDRCRRALRITLNQPARFHPDIRINILLDVSLNLALLAVVWIVCSLCDRLVPDAALNGGYVFMVLAAAALLFDAALTFLVFADAEGHYGQFSTTDAFLERAVACFIGVALAFACARFTSRQQASRRKADDGLVIRTSAYSESHLRM